jgi:prolyl oligopeptidase
MRLLTDLPSSRLLTRAFVLGAIVATFACTSPYPNPPDTRTDDVVDTLHGVAIADPYRWLEDQDAPEVREWIDQQNAYADTVVGQSPLRDRIRQRYAELTDLPSVGSPRNAGDYQIFTLRRPGQEQTGIYRRPKPEEDDEDEGPLDPYGDYEVVLDPHTMSSDFTTTVGIISIDRDGERMIYNVRDGGEDEVTIHVLDLETGEQLPDSMPRGLYGDFSFKRDGSGFYYSLRSRVTGGRVYFHEWGADMADDVELFGDGYGPDKFVGMSQLNSRYLLFDVWHGWSRVELYVQDLEDGGPPVSITGDAQARFYPQFIEDELHMRTNLDASN